jgi:hypothetical protein
MKDRSRRQMGTYSPALARASKNALTGCSLQRAGYGENVLKIKRGDLLFLLNLDTNTLYGTFLAQSQGAKNIAPEVWKSRISIPSGGIAKWHSALILRRKKTFSGMGISWHDMLDEDLAQSLSRYLENPDRRLKLIKKTAVYKPRLEIHYSLGLSPGKPMARFKS